MSPPLPSSLPLHFIMLPPFAVTTSRPAEPSLPVAQASPELVPPPTSPTKTCAINNDAINNDAINNDKENVPIEANLIAPKPIKIAINPL